MNARLRIWLLVTVTVLGWGLLGCRSSQPSPSTSTPSPPEETETLPALTPSEPATTTPKEPLTEGTSPTSTLIVLTAAPVSTLDPYHMVSRHPDGSVGVHLWDTLVRIDDWLTLEPSLAESWRLIDNQTWEFTLRQGVTFHNGEPFDAEAVRFSVDRAQRLPDSLEPLGLTGGLITVEVVNTYTVRLATEKPMPNLPYLVASLEILPPGRYQGQDDAAVASDPVGTGPYRFVSQEADGSVILDAFSDYWRGAPAVQRIVFRPVPDVTQRLEALQRGEAQLITDLPPARAEEANTETSRLETIESTRRLFVGIRFDPDSPLADKRVRQALNYAVNVQELVERYHAGYGQRYASWVNPPNANPDLEPWPYDPERARNLLAEAGYPDGFATTLDTPVGRYPQDEAIAYAIAEQLAAVGVQAQVQPQQDWETYVRQKLITKETAPLFLLAIASEANDLEDVRNLAYDFPLNPTGWFNEEFEAMLDEAKVTFNVERRQELLYQAQALAYDEAPWIWLWRLYDFYGVANGLAWTPRADGVVDLYWSVEEAPSD